MRNSSLLAVSLFMAVFFCGCATIREKTYTNYEGKITELVPEMRPKVATVLEYVRKKYPQYEWVVKEAYRSPKRQTELYKVGRRGIPNEKILTDVKVSKHTRRMAADIYPQINKRLMKYEEASNAYNYYGKVAKKLGLIWGGDWQNPKDYGHIELRIPDGKK